MNDSQPQNLDGRVERLDESVERLTSEVASLKQELVSMTSALRALQSEKSARRVIPAVKAVPVEVPAKPSMAPAAVVVLMALGLLSWQLLATPRPEPMLMIPSIDPATSQALTIPPPDPRPTEPPITPLVTPTIYKGTLTVNSDTPGATVFVNRQIVGQAPVRVRNLRAGAHLVWVEHDGYRRWTRVVTVPAERVTRVSAALEPVATQ